MYNTRHNKLWKEWLSSLSISENKYKSLSLKYYLYKLQKLWKQVVYEGLAEHSQITFIYKKKLKVCCTHDIYASQIKTLEKEILSNISKLAGTEYSELIITVGRLQPSFQLNLELNEIETNKQLGSQKTSVESMLNQNSNSTLTLLIDRLVEL